MKRVGTAHGARARGACFGTLSAPISGAPMEHIARGNGSMLVARLTALTLFHVQLLLPIIAQHEEDAYDGIDHRLALLLQAPPGYLRQRQRTSNA